MKKAYIILVSLLIVALALGYYLFRVSSLNTDTEDSSTVNVLKEVVVEDPAENIVTTDPLNITSEQKSVNTENSPELLNDASIDDLEAVLGELDDLTGLENNILIE